MTGHSHITYTTVIAVKFSVLLFLFILWVRGSVGSEREEKTLDCVLTGREEVGCELTWRGLEVVWKVKGVEKR